MTPRRGSSPPSAQWAAILSALFVQAAGGVVAPLEADVAVGVADLAARASVCVNRHAAVSAAWRPRTSGPHRTAEKRVAVTPPGFDFVC